MGKIDLDRVRRSFAKSDHQHGRAKGQALERTVIDVFSQVPGLELVSHDVRDATGAEEIDLGFRNLRPPDGLVDFGPQVLVECKNWDRPVSSEQVGWFVHKLRHAQQQSGILVAALGVTGDRTARTHALSEIYAARLAQPPVNVVVVARHELERMGSTEALVRLLHWKLFNVIVHGAYYEHSDDEHAEASPAPAFARLVERTASAKTFASFNAGNMRPREVAEQFLIRPPLFAFAAPRNAVLLGSRGTGKTAMLRMLQPHALDFADNPPADSLRESLTYVGVYVPLSTVRETATESFLREPALVMTLIAAVAIERLAEEFARELDEQVADDEERAALDLRLAHRLAEAWGFRRASAPSMAALALEVRRRRAEVARVLAEELDGRKSDPAGAPATSKTADLYAAAAAGVRCFNELADQSRQWCLLLDDVDTVDASLSAEIFKWMRASEPDLLIKLTCSPSAEGRMLKAATAMPMMDYEVVSLPESPPYDFGAAMLREAAARFGLMDTTPEQIFGPSAGVTNLEQSVSRLASVDEGFAAWADRVGVHENPRTPRASAELRRASQLIVLRESLLSGTGGSLRLRSRKSPVWCIGSPTIIRFFDGVPRMLLSFLNRSLSSVDDTGKVPAAVQARELLSLTDRFVELLRAIPIPDTEMSVLDVLDRIGEALTRSVLGTTFISDPVLSVIIDDDVADDTRRALMIALDLGAVFPTSRQLARPTVRLAHILAPRYRLPVRVGRAVTLSRLIG